MPDKEEELPLYDPSEAPPEPEEEGYDLTPPEPEATPAPEDKQYSRSFKQSQIDKLLKMRMDALSDASVNKSVPVKTSTAPDWFKGGPPPSPSPWSGIVGALTGGLAAQNQMAAQEKLRPLGMRMQDAKSAALLQGFGGVLQNALNKKQNEYNQNLEAAGKEAAMNKVSSGSSASKSRLDQVNDILRFASNESAQEDLAKKREFDQEQTRNLHATGNPELQKMVDALAASGRFTPEQLNALASGSLFGFQRAAPIINTTVGADSREAVANANAANRRGDIVAQANTHSNLQAQKLRNEDTQRANEYSLNSDDAFWVNGNPPEHADAQEGRELLAARQSAMAKLADMKRIQQRLNELHHGFLGTWDEYMGAPEVQNLVVEARNIRQDLADERRIRTKMGVPQAWEQKMLTSMIPAAGSIQGWLKGEAAWDALTRQLDRDTHIGLLSKGIGLRSKSDAPKAAASYEETNKPVAPVKTVRAGKAQEPDVDAEPMPLPDEKLPTAPVPPISAAPAAAPAPVAGGAQKYRVTFGGKTFERVLTPEQVKKAPQGAKLEPIP